MKHDSPELYRSITSYPITDYTVKSRDIMVKNGLFEERNDVNTKFILDSFFLTFQNTLHFKCLMEMNPGASCFFS